VTAAFWYTPQPDIICAYCGNYILDDDHDALPSRVGGAECGDCRIKFDLAEEEHGRPALEEEDFHGCR